MPRSQDNKCSYLDSRPRWYNFQKKNSFRAEKLLVFQLNKFNMENIQNIYVNKRKQFLDIGDAGIKRSSFYAKCSIKKPKKPRLNIDPNEVNVS